MTRRRLIIGASIAAAAIGCWWCVVRPIQELRISGIRPWRGPPWHCQHHFMVAHCDRAWPSERAHAPRRAEGVSFCLTSFHVLGFSEGLAFGDSLSWQRGRDSVELSMRAQRGDRRVVHLYAPVSPPQSRMAIPIDSSAFAELWLMPAWHISLTGSPGGTRPGSSPAPYIWESGGPERMVGCQYELERRHVVTISDALAAIHRTIAEQIGF